MAKAYIMLASKSSARRVAESGAPAGVRRVATPRLPLEPPRLSRPVRASAAGVRSHLSSRLFPNDHLERECYIMVRRYVRSMPMR